MLGRGCGLVISQEAHVKVLLMHKDSECEAAGRRRDGGVEVVACEVEEEKSSHRNEDDRLQ